MGVRIAVDHLDAVIPEERIAEARGVNAGCRCLALLHRAEAAVPRETVTILNAIFSGDHCSWCKQSTQRNRRGQCRTGDGHCSQHAGGHLAFLPPCLRCALFGPRAQRARVKAGKSSQILRKEGEPARGEADLHRRAGRDRHVTAERLYFQSLGNYRGISPFPLALLDFQLGEH